VNVLEVEHLTVRFGRNEVLRDLSFAVPARSALAVVGPNGAGKTVLFQALIGAVPYEGRVRWAPGTRLGYVPQKLDIERDVPITGGDLMRARAGMVRASKAEVAQALERVGLAEDVPRAQIGTLSGGQFQRLLMAFALLGRPSVLLLDEPTAGVDQPGQERLTRAVARVREEEGVTVLFISHDLTVVHRYADHVLCLSRGYTCFGVPRKVLTAETLAALYGGAVGLHVHDHAAHVD